MILLQMHQQAVIKTSLKMTQLKASLALIIMSRGGIVVVPNDGYGFPASFATPAFKKQMKTGFLDVVIAENTTVIPKGHVFSS